MRYPERRGQCRDVQAIRTDTPHADLVAKPVGRYLSPMELGVVLGDSSVAPEFSALPFDHLVVTGRMTAGRHVMRAAADSLIPETLELGGKSPMVIDEGGDIAAAAHRTLTVKTFNAGQICLPPDYVMLPEGKVDAFVSAAKDFMQAAFPTVRGNPDYTSISDYNTIVSNRHFDRLVAMIANAEAKRARIVSLTPAGEPPHDRVSRQIAPTLIIGATDDMLAIQEEIFGPVLPIRTVGTLSLAVTYINANPRPLAPHFFGDDARRQQAFARGTASGALVIKEIMTHAAIEGLPFGDEGASGIGAYHGIHRFRRFSHARPVVQQSPDGANGMRLRAPYAGKLPVLQTILSN